MDNQELNAIAQIYASQKKELEAAREELRNSKINYNNSVKLFKNQKNELENAKANKDAKGVEEAKKQIMLLKKEFEQSKADLEQKRAVFNALKENVNSLTNKVKADPEMNMFLESVVQKRCERQISKDNKELNKLNERAIKLQTMQALCSNDADIAKNFRGLLNSKARIMKLNEELSKAASKEESNEIKEKMTQEQEKYQALKIAIMKHAKRKGVQNLSQDVIDSSTELITQNGVVHLKKGDKELEATDLRATFEKHLNRTNKRIKTIKKDISKYETAFEQREPIKNEAMVPVNSQSRFSRFLNVIRHPIQAYRNWKNKRETAQEAPADTLEATNIDVKNNKFRDSLKEKNVRDMVNDMYKEELRNTRQEGNRSRDDEGR